MSWETGTANEYIDLIDKLNAFLNIGHSLPPTYTGTGNGTISGVLGTSTSSQETITVTLTGATTFSVSGSVTGSMGTGTVGSLFTHSKVKFTVNAGGTAWVNGDTISFIMTVPWVTQRIRGGVITNTGFTDSFFAYDVLPGTRAYISAASLPGYLGLQFLTAEDVTSFTVQAHTTVSLTPASLAIEYSDNGSSYTTHQTWSSLTWTSQEIKTFTVTTSPGSHKYWRIKFISANGATLEVAEIVFYNGSRNLYSAEAIWKAPGNTNEDQIFVGVSAFSNSTGNYFNWRLGGFTGFDSLATFTGQAGACTRPVLPLWYAPMTYWFFADGAHVTIVVKVSTIFEVAYLGFLRSYSTPALWSYPLVVGGSMSWKAEPVETSTNWKYAYQGREHRAFFFPWDYYWDTDNNSQVRLRLPDGSWSGFISYDNMYDDYPNVWPVTYGPNDLRANIDGSIPTFPFVLSSPTPNVYGEFFGVRFVSGNGQTSENTLTIGRDTYFVVQNTYNVGTRDYAAILMA